MKKKGAGDASRIPALACGHGLGARWANTDSGAQTASHRLENKTST